MEQDKRTRHRHVRQPRRRGHHATFSQAGTYVLRLTANDGALTASDEVTVTVTDPGPVNQAPVVNAGADQSAVAPATVSLHGTVTDDGLPNRPVRSPQPGPRSAVAAP